MSMRASQTPLKRLLTALFPALLGPSQLLLFGPETIYSINQVEFLVPYSSLAAQWMWLLMAVGGGLAAIGVALPDRLFAYYISALFGLGTLTWVQGNLLVADYGLLYGEGLDLAPHAWRMPLDIGLWLGGMALAVKFAPAVSKVAPLASQVLIGSQAVVLIASTIGFAADSEESVEWQVPPPEVYELSRTRNVIHIVLDGFQSEYFADIVAANKDEFDRDFSGFVFFADHLGAFPTTRASMPAMFTGHTYRNEQPFDDFQERVTEQEWSIFTVLDEVGFQIRSVSFLGNDHPAAALPSGRESTRYTIPEPYGSYRDYVDFASAQLVDLSLFRHVPHGFKSHIYNDRAWLLQRRYMRRQPADHTAGQSRAGGNTAFLSEFARRMTLGPDDPVYTFFHLATPHPPIVTENDCAYQKQVAMTPDSYRAQGRCALLVVQELLDRLRALDIYDSSVIVLTSDHGWGVQRSDSLLRGIRTPAGNLDVVALYASPLLAIKPADRTGPLEPSYAPTAISDIPATIVDLVGVPNVFSQGRSAFEIDPEEQRTRSYTHHSWTNAGWSRPYFDKLQIFSIDGRVTDPASWRYQRVIFEPTDDLEAQLSAHRAGLIEAADGPFYWSTVQAVIYVPPDARRFTFEARKAMAVTPTQTVTIRVNGQVVGEREFSDDKWHKLTYELRSQDDGTNPICIELLVSPGWRDSRNIQRGAMVRNFAWTR